MTDTTETGGTPTDIVAAESNALSLLRSFPRILALGAHPDDVELGCGGTIALATSLGCEVTSVALSDCRDETPSGHRDVRKLEFTRAAKVLGAIPRIYDIPNREFPEHRVMIMEILARLQAELRPNLVMCSYIEDPHQDHSTLALACVRSFRRNETIIEYEILRHGSYSFTPSVFVDITSTIELKVRALSEYKTQIKRRAYFDKESFVSLARARGAQSGLKYAEGFIAYKMYW